MSSLRTSKWIQLNNPPRQPYKIHMASINQHEFIIVPETKKSIERFNIITNQWTSTKCDTAENHTDAFYEMLSFCPTAQKLFSVSATRCSQNAKELYTTLGTLDIMSGQFTATKIKCHGLAMKFSNIHINGKMHLIGGEPPSHLKYDEDYQSFETVFDFKKDESFDIRIGGATTIYVPSKQMIILIGAYDLWPKRFVGVWIYSLVINKWKKLPIELNTINAAAVLTSDEKNIIIVGGNCVVESRAYSTRVNSIYVLGISDFDKPQDFVMQKSVICLPNEESVNVAITGGYKDEILVTGYVKLLFKMTEFKELRLPPVYIMQIIERYFDVETLHWIDDDMDENTKHFAICVKHILTNLEETDSV